MYKMRAMKVHKQLSVFLENKPGTLARVSGALAARRVNIIAFSITDAADHGVMRMVVSNPFQAAHILGEGGMMVIESDVMAVDLPNRPGSLARLAERLARAKVNIEYAYGSTGARKNKAQLILKVDNTRRALKALGQK